MPPIYITTFQYYYCHYSQCIRTSLSRTVNLRPRRRPSELVRYVPNLHKVAVPPVSSHRLSAFFFWKAKRHACMPCMTRYDHERPVSPRLGSRDFPPGPTARMPRFRIFYYFSYATGIFLFAILGEMSGFCMGKSHIQ